MSQIDEFIEAVRHYGIERVFQRYYGFYEAVVVSNKDPEKRGRVQVVCPAVGHSEKNPPNVWVLPAFSASGTKHGEFHPPEEGDAVRVTFEQGDASRPQVYVGGWFGKEEVPDDLKYSSSGYPDRRGIVTRGGHQLIFSDEPDKQFVRLMWHKPAEGDKSLTDRKVAADVSSGDFASLSFNSDGDAFLANKDSSYIHLDAKNDQLAIMMQANDGSTSSIHLTKKNILILDNDGNTIEINTAGKSVNVITKGDVNVVGQRINLQGGSVFIGDKAALSAVLGEPLMIWLTAHVHAGVQTGPGVSGPPVVPPSGILSQKVKVG